MEFETIRKSHKKEIIIGVSLFVILVIALVVRLTFAKYNLVKSIKIAEGTISYKVPDFKIMAMYKNDGNGDIEIDTMPETGYIINESKTYCEVNGAKDINAGIYTDDVGQHIITNITKGSRCYLYFVKSAASQILENITVKSGTPDFSKVATTDEGVYKAVDESGKDSYYFRGAVNNNYVRFANKWWRIIRINGDGSIRLIYDGTSGHANGTSTSDSIAIASQTFNSSYNNNAYVGFKYTSDEVHGLGTKSNALTQLEIWYQNNLSSYASKIDTNAGFCGDRTPSTSSSSINNSGGTGTTQTYYAGYIRLNTNKSPDLTCANSSDFYTVSSSNKGNKSLTYPIGLITADEIAVAGGVWGTNNTRYYLYNGQRNWTLSPYILDSGNEAYVFGIHSSGNITAWCVTGVTAMRPVISLKADTKFTGKGTMSDPYVVN